jgi:hypothetical protein
MDHKGSTLDSLLVETGELEEVNQRLAERAEDLRHYPGAAYEHGYQEGLDAAAVTVLNGCATAVATKGKMTCFACRQAADRIRTLKEPKST